MVVVVNFADEKFRPWQQLQTQTAYHFGADKVIEYSPADIDPEFYEKNKFILDQPRGAGYWLWKPYIILDALNKVDDGDIVSYLDSGAFFINRISYLTNTMDAEKVNIMVFGSDIGKTLERHWTKRDAFILMDCDEERFFNSPPAAGGGFELLRKCAESIEFVKEWLKYMQDPRIVTDIPNQLGKENYEGFRENRHDQTVLSLLVKKKGIKSFKCPMQENFPSESYSPELLRRSDYPPIIHLHRRAVGFNRSLEDFLRIYGRAPRLCEGIRSARFLLEEGLVKESYELLWRLLEKYGDENPKDWAGTWDDMLAITSKHKEIGAPYAETFQPLLCKMFVKFLSYNPLTPYQIPSLFSVVRCMENKALIPQEFQNALIQLVVAYYNQFGQVNMPATMWSAREVWEKYLELDMPETPLKKYALEKMGGVHEIVEFAELKLCA